MPWPVHSPPHSDGGSKQSDSPSADFDIFSVKHFIVCSIVLDVPVYFHNSQIPPPLSSSLLQEYFPCVRFPQRICPVLMVGSILN